MSMFQKPFHDQQYTNNNYSILSPTSTVAMPIRDQVPRNGPGAIRCRRQDAVHAAAQSPHTAAPTTAPRAASPAHPGSRRPNHVRGETLLLDSWLVCLVADRATTELESIIWLGLLTECAMGENQSSEASVAYGILMDGTNGRSISNVGSRYSVLESVTLTLHFEDALEPSW